MVEAETNIGDGWQTEHFWFFWFTKTQAKVHYYANNDDDKIAKDELAHLQGNKIVDKK